MNEVTRIHSHRQAASRVRPRILIADDDSSMREALADFLRSEGYEVDVADGGAAALAALTDRERRPSLLILDLNMPAPNGWHVLEELAKRRECATTSTIVLSGARDVATPLPRIRWMRKPIAPDDLLATVRTALSPPRRMDDA